MSRFITKEGDKYIEEIESMEVCRWKINEVCCNDKSEHLGDFPTFYLDCDSNKDCEHFEKEDGIIGDD